ncbi:MAG: hypothetical protein RBS43_10530, partial [Candidatus Cloacimonas sp.]|nr:hypothetical protein [Candidatus Cloacimonas sp.]
MPTALPVSILDMLSVLNLPAELEANPIFKGHRGLVLETIKGVVLSRYYGSACNPSMSDDDPLYIAFRFAYCFYMLHSTCEFLNLKTLGEGIVKTVGLDQSATELLTGAEIDAFKSKLELRALTALSAYLNDAGKERLSIMVPRPPRVIRVGV